MVEITLFEIHFDDTTFDAQATANAPLGGLFGDEADDSGEESGEAADSTAAGGAGLGKLLLGVALLGALAALAARMLDREDVDDLIDAAGEEIEIETGATEREADN